MTKKIFFKVMHAVGNCIGYIVANDLFEEDFLPTLSMCEDNYKLFMREMRLAMQLNKTLAEEYASIIYTKLNIEIDNSINEDFIVVLKNIPSQKYIGIEPSEPFDFKTLSELINYKSVLIEKRNHFCKKIDDLRQKILKLEEDATGISREIRDIEIEEVQELFS